MNPTENRPNMQKGKKNTYIPDKDNPWNYRYSVVIKRVRYEKKKVNTFITSHRRQMCTNKAYEAKGKVVSRKRICLTTGEFMKEWSDTNMQERTL